MGVVADLARQYEEQIDRLRQDNAILYDELSEQAAYSAVLQQENQQLRAAHRKELSQPSQ